MSIKNSLVLLFLNVILLISVLSAQDETGEIIIQKGLALKLPGSRQALLMKDPVEQSLVLGKWTPPQEGTLLVIEGDSAVWEAITADENGWFSERTRRGGYVYTSVEAEKDQVMLLEGMGNDLAYVNGELRTGNRYGYKEDWSPWEPKFDYSILPIRLKSGTNHFLFFNTRTGRLKVKLKKPASTIRFNTKDMTLPDLIVGEKVDTWGSVVVINASSTPLKNFIIQSKVGSAPMVATEVNVIQPMTVRKIGFQLKGPAPADTGMVPVELQILDGPKSLASTVIKLRSVFPLATHIRTFISEIDGSVQYYAVNPAQDSNPDTPKALVLSVHGAGVKALNQVNSYYGKTWAHIVAPTNRRPYGFNWEDWGRMDALEVLEIIQEKLNIDSDRIYLTGHSMGGHGTWHLGVTYPDQFAAIGPSAGWISFWSYRVRERMDEQTPMQKMLMRATLPSNTMDLAENCKQHGVYVIHGADDDNVRVEQSRMIVEHLKPFHQDLIYHEEPGQGHWWDVSDESGTDCVDWMPLFDFFARHARPGKTRIRQINFKTASPGVSAQNNWVTIEAQTEQLKMSQVNLRFDPGKNRIVGTTQNVARISFDLAGLSSKNEVNIELDSINVGTAGFQDDQKKIYLTRTGEKWQVIEKPSADLKGPQRYGTFKDAFKNRVLFVYGTKGSQAENAWAYAKARYDAEHFWYQGNGSIDIISDVEFDPKKEPDRNVILYGNSKTNAAWKILLQDSPVQVTNGKVQIGKRTLKGKDLGVLFIRPRPNSEVASVGAVAGTGIVGMQLTNRRPYLGPGYAYPDVIVFNPDLISAGDKGVEVAGFFGLDWRIETGEFIWSSDVE